MLRLTPSLLAGGLALAALLLGSSPPSARVVRVEVDAVHGPVQVVVEAVASATGGEPLRRTVVAPGEVILDLPPEGSWVLRANAPGYWAREALLTGNDAAATLRLLPAGHLRVRLEAPRGISLPAALAAHLQPTGPLQAAAGGAVTACPVTAGLWSCPVPAGRWDLRLRAKGFASHLRWAVEVGRRATADLGTVELRAGASLLGRVEIDARGAGPGGVEVVLAPQQIERPEDSGAARRLALHGLRARTDPRGVFHFEGIAPGRYTVRAVRPGFAPATSAAVDILEGLEAEILHPLTLRRPTLLEVRLLPARHPYGDRWHLKLMATEAASQRLDTVAEGIAGEDGTWRSKEVPAGAYRLFVEDGAGVRWSAEEVRVEPGGDPLDLALDLVPVEGTLRLGRKPLTATLWMTGNERRRVRFEADQDGELAGWLPAEGRWWARIESGSPPLRQTVGEIEVRRADGQRVARVDVVVPDTRVLGTVVDEAGEPVPAAEVQAMSLAQKGASLLTRSDEAGRFELRGLPPGPAGVSASEHDRASEWTAISLTEEAEESDLRLTLRRRAVVRGRVVAAAGGVPAARLSVLPDFGAVPLAAGTQATSDPEGGFELHLPAAVRSFSLLVFAPGFPLRVAHLPAVPPADELLTIDLRGQGGTLVLDLGTAPGGGAPRQLPVLVHDGAILPLDLLRGWAALHGSAPAGSAAATWTVPAVAAGDYALCRGRTAILGATAGTAAPGCSRGTLLPGGELRLAAIPSG